MATHQQPGRPAVLLAALALALTACTGTEVAGVVHEADPASQDGGAPSAEVPDCAVAMPGDHC
jgi:hypothetical protein